ncbi:MAG: polysaccharide biosynthesis tyrosine autokinase [Melioribacteraceae bacterium]|nr:polysaccharide biosynthesis tyrosine autokinase [Melioribacteraceae bacterium]
MVNKNDITSFRDSENETNSLKDYINLIRTNIIPIIIVTLVGLIVAILYAINAQNIYKSTAYIKLEKPKGGGILENPFSAGFSDFGSDRFIANEIEIMQSWSTREKVAEALIDSFRFVNAPDSFYLLLDRELFSEKDGKVQLKSKESITRMLEGIVTIEQKRGIDFVEVTVESPRPYEAALIANSYAQEYYNRNLELNRQQLVSIREFLGEQREEKLDQLVIAEERLKNYQEEGGIIALPEQASALIAQLTDFEAKMNAVKIDLTISERNLNEFKQDLANKDPKLKDYLESQAAQPYLESLQEQIAKEQTKKDNVLASGSLSRSNNELIKEIDNKLEELRRKLNEEISKRTAGLLASSPEEIKSLTQKVFEEEVKYRSLLASYNELSRIVRDYESRFNQLPDQSIGLARLQREQTSFEKLYLLIEEKYQEAIINERSQPGDVFIVDKARIAAGPSRPNRPLIILVGLILGLGMGFGYAFIRNYFDNTIKTPEDILKRNFNVLAWIPQFQISDTNKEFEFIVAKKPDSIPSEAFRALRTRIQFSKIDRDSIKTILVTSSTPKEGKTTVSVNLAGSFAQTNKKTLIIDCDLRKPRMHTVFKDKRFPGFTDYFFGQATYEEIVRKSDLNNLYYITAGTIPPNPSEILGSKEMEQFLKKLKTEFEMIILDSPPVIAVTDSEILSSLVDATILVVSADQTEVELMQKSAELLQHQHGSFLGVLLNNFTYKSGYGSYYKYYYYYSRPSNDKAKKKVSV